MADSGKAPPNGPKRMGGHDRFYVYVLEDPRDDTVFYVGKGQRHRMHAHLADYQSGRVSNAAKHSRIHEIVSDGRTPRPRVVLSGLTEREAFREERRLIGAYGVKNLTNLLPGFLDQEDRMEAWAKGVLGTIKDFREWCAERRRSSDEQSLFLRVRDEIGAMAAGLRQLEARP